MCANELAHKTVGTELTQAEYEAVGGHVFDSQAAGDIAYASSTTQISRLAKGTDGDSLTLASGIPAWNTPVQSDVTASRAIDGTVYQNTTGRPLLVAVNVRCNVDEDGGGELTGQSTAEAYTDTNAAPTTQVAQIGAKVLTNTSGAFGGSDYFDIECQMTFVVLPSSYYKVGTTITGGGAAPTLHDWFEWEL